MERFFSSNNLVFMNSSRFIVRHCLFIILKNKDYSDILFTDDKTAGKSLTYFKYQIYKRKANHERKHT